MNRSSGITAAGTDAIARASSQIRATPWRVASSAIAVMTARRITLAATDTVSGRSACFCENDSNCRVNRAPD